MRRSGHIRGKKEYIMNNDNFVQERAYVYDYLSEEEIRFIRENTLKDAYENEDDNNGIIIIDII